MQNINLNEKNLNNMLSSSICLMHSKANLVKVSKCICFQHTVSDYEIMRNEVYTSAIVKDISAIEDNASAIENDTLAIKDDVSAIAIYIPAIADGPSAIEINRYAIEINRYAIDKNGFAIKDDHFAIENNKYATENDTPASPKYVYAGFETNKTTNSMLTS
jgi:hypothetical protein